MREPLFKDTKQTPGPGSYNSRPQTGPANSNKRTANRFAIYGNYNPKRGTSA